MNTLFRLAGWITIWFVMSHGYHMDEAYKNYTSSGDQQYLVTMYYYMFYTALSFAAAWWLLWLSKEEKIIVEVTAYEESQSNPAKINLESDEENNKT